MPLGNDAKLVTEEGNERESAQIELEIRHTMLLAHQVTNRGERKSSWNIAPQ